jgi:hypothetical protein
LSVEFAITYRGLERPRRFQYVVKNLVDDGALGHSLWEAYWNGRDDLAQIAVDALDCKVAELVHEWAEFRLEQLAVQNA